MGAVGKRWRVTTCSFWVPVSRQNGREDEADTLGQSANSWSVGNP